MFNIPISNIFRTKILDKTLVRFVFFGVFNTILTNIILQVLLFLIPTIYAALASQIFNFSFGFYFYGKKVFGIKSLNHSFFIRYIFLNILIWKLNWVLINTINSYNISKNLASIILIPFLAFFSYFSQKRIIFI